MDKKIENFLEFNGKTIYTLNKDGVYWIAVKPICDVLNVNYNRQFKNLKKHKILGPVLADQPIQVPNDQGRKMVCLPEKYIYGWLFSINSASAELLEYKKKCYDVLYDYFHGAITRRQQVLREKVQVLSQVKELEQALSVNEDYKKLQELRVKQRLYTENLKQLDQELTGGQINLFN